MSNDVWVVAEHARGQLGESTLETVSKGRELAHAMGGKLAAIGRSWPGVIKPLRSNGRTIRLLRRHDTPHDLQEFGAPATLRSSLF